MPRGTALPAFIARLPTNGSVPCSKYPPITTLVVCSWCFSAANTLVVAGRTCTVAAGFGAPFAAWVGLDEVEHAMGRVAGAQVDRCGPGEQFKGVVSELSQGASAGRGTLFVDSLQLAVMQRQFGAGPVGEQRVDSADRVVDLGHGRLCVLAPVCGAVGRQSTKAVPQQQGVIEFSLARRFGAVVVSGGAKPTVQCGSVGQFVVHTAGIGPDGVHEPDRRWFVGQEPGG